MSFKQTTCKIRFWGFFFTQTTCKIHLPHKLLVKYIFPTNYLENTFSPQTTCKIHLPHIAKKKNQSPNLNTIPNVIFNLHIAIDQSSLYHFHILVLTEISKNYINVMVFGCTYLITILQCKWIKLNLHSYYETRSTVIIMRASSCNDLICFHLSPEESSEGVIKFIGL